MTITRGNRDVALWNPSRRSRVNSGQRFNRGFDREALMENRLVA